MVPMSLLCVDIFLKCLLPTGNTPDVTLKGPYIKGPGGKSSLLRGGSLHGPEL
jgi:hypothetical protein